MGTARPSSIARQQQGHPAEGLLVRTIGVESTTNTQAYAVGIAARARWAHTTGEPRAQFLLYRVQSGVLCIIKSASYLSTLYTP
jgi:hypothetical protein